MSRGSKINYRNKAYTSVRYLEVFEQLQEDTWFEAETDSQC